MRVWRISNYEDLSGIGGTFTHGRWNKLGRKIIYTSDHPSTCMLEMLVRFDPKYTPKNYKLLEIELADTKSIKEAKLPNGWEQNPEITQGIWDEFCEKNSASVLKVPSVIMPQATHYLINPYHAEHGEHKIVEAYDNILDERFYD